MRGLYIQERDREINTLYLLHCRAKAPIITVSFIPPSHVILNFRYSDSLTSSYSFLTQWLQLVTWNLEFVYLTKDSSSKMLWELLGFSSGVIIAVTSSSSSPSSIDRFE